MLRKANRRQPRSSKGSGDPSSRRAPASPSKRTDQPVPADRVWRPAAISIRRPGSTGLEETPKVAKPRLEQTEPSDARQSFPAPAATASPQNYEVGHGKPPKHTQFKKGQSGNPKGRPKGRKNFETEFLEELSQQVTITENGKKMKVSKQRALIKKLFIMAADGKPKALDAVHKMIERYGSQQKPNETGKEELTPEDQAIMDELLGKSKKSRAESEDDADEAEVGDEFNDDNDE